MDQLFSRVPNDEAVLASALETVMEDDNAGEIVIVNLPSSGKVKLVCDGLNIEVDINLARLLSKPTIDKTWTDWFILKDIQHHDSDRRDSLISLAPPHHPPNTFPFFKLPGELRNQVYHLYTTSLFPTLNPQKFTLTTPDSGLYDFALKEKDGHNTQSDISTFLSKIHSIPLLRASRQSRAEFTSYLFAHTPLELRGLKALTQATGLLHASFLAQIRTLKIVLLECLDLKDPVYDQREFIAGLLAPCKNLTELDIEYKIGIESLLTELSPFNRRDCFEGMVADGGKAKAERVGAFAGLATLRERGVKVGLEGSVRLRFRGEAGFVDGEEVAAGEGFEREVRRVMLRKGF